MFIILGVLSMNKTRINAEIIKKSMLVILIIPFFSLIAGEMKISMKLWNRYTAQIMDGELNESAFTLERGYFRVEPAFTDKIKGRFNLDFFSDDDGVNGASVKLKYANPSTRFVETWLNGLNKENNPCSSAEVTTLFIV